MTACNHPERATEDRALEERARRAYEADPLRVIGAGPWDNLPEVMRAVWRAHVTGNLPPR